jgi:hypothetical protein
MEIMKKLTELLRLNQVAGLFGVEIEVEGDDLPNVDTAIWRSEADGSLRGGIEYVMKEPVTQRSLALALRQLTRKLDEAGAKLDFSFRTSVHFHVNVQELTAAQVCAMIYTYILLEGPLMTFCGDIRKGNRFCLRYEDAESMDKELSEMFRMGDEGMRRRPNDKMRYAAINIEALSKYGSLEFRAMQGNIDIPRLTAWGDILAAIRVYAVEKGSPTAVFESLTEHGDPTKFLTEVVGEGLASLLNVPSAAREIQRNMSLSMDLPFAFKRGNEERVAYAEKQAKRKAAMALEAVRDMEPDDEQEEMMVVMDEIEMPQRMRPPPPIRPVAMPRVVVRDWQLEGIRRDFIAAPRAGKMVKFKIAE